MAGPISVIRERKGRGQLCPGLSLLASSLCLAIVGKEGELETIKLVVGVDLDNRRSELWDELVLKALRQRIIHCFQLRGLLTGGVGEGSHNEIQVLVWWVWSDELWECCQVWHGRRYTRGRRGGVSLLLTVFVPWVASIRNPSILEEVFVGSTECHEIIYLSSLATSLQDSVSQEWDS